MNYNEINKLNISEDVKRMYTDLYEIVNNESIDLDNLKNCLISIADYNYYTASIQSNIINKILEELNESLFNEEESKYLSYINFIVEKYDIFLDNSLFNYDEYYTLFNILADNLGNEYINMTILKNSIIFDYDEMLQYAYEIYRVPENLHNYIDDNKLIRDMIFDSNNIYHDAKNHYEFNESTSFVITQN